MPRYHLSEIVVELTSFAAGLARGWLSSVLGSITVFRHFCLGCASLDFAVKTQYGLPRQAVEVREFDMSEKIASEVISRRRAFSLLGLAAALGVALPTTVLTVSDAEAQTAGSERREERRTGRKERREERSTGRKERREERAQAARSSRTKTKMTNSRCSAATRRAVALLQRPRGAHNCVHLILAQVCFGVQ